MNDAIKTTGRLYVRADHRANRRDRPRLDLPVSVLSAVRLNKAQTATVYISIDNPAPDYNSKLVKIEEVKVITLKSTLSDKKVLECIQKVPYVSVPEIVHITGLGAKFVNSAVDRLRSDGNVCVDFRRYNAIGIKVYFVNNGCDGKCKECGINVP